MIWGWLIPGWLRRAVAAAGVALVGLLTVIRLARKNERQRADLDAVQRARKQESEGRDAVAEERRATDGASARDVVDRLRKRDGDWRGLR